MTAADPLALARPRLLDLFCGAGGAARGYQQAGFHVTGVDNRPQPRYCGDALAQADALEYLAEHGGEYDAIHASPPCQGYSVMRNLPWLRQKEYPLLIEPVRELLKASGRPWVIENVMGARKAANMQAGWLCGTMFGRPFYRHRLFESSFFWLAPGHPKHKVTIRSPRSLGGRARDFIFSQAEDGWGLARWDASCAKKGICLIHTSYSKVGAIREAMEIDWMVGEELNQAIPPVYLEYIGRCLIKTL